MGEHTEGTPPVEFQKIHELSRTVDDFGVASDPDAVYEAVVTAADRLFAFDACTVFVPDGSTFDVAATSCDEPDVRDGPGTPTGGESRERPLPADGTVRNTYRTEESTLVEETNGESDTTQSAGYRSAMTVPLGERAVVRISSSRPARYERHDLELIELLAVHAEKALERLSSERARGTHKRKMKQLHRVATELESCSTHREAFELMIDASQEVLGFEWSGVHVVEDEYFVAAAVSDESPVGVGERTLRVGEGAAGTAYRTGESKLIHDAHADDEAEPSRREFRSGMAVPVGDFGIFAPVSPEKSWFDEDDLELAELLAANVAEAYERIEVQTQLQSRREELNLLKEIQTRVLRHNIRNALTVLENVGSELQTRYDDPLLETILAETDELAATAEKARKMAAVIDRDGRQKRDLATVTGDVVGRVETTLDAHIRTTLAEPAPVETHPDIDLAIENLVENAVVHGTPDDGDPAVSVCVTATDDAVTCLVADDGPGILEHEIEVLERESESALEHSSGVGLWLVRWIVDRSEGDLSFESSADGTTVRIRLPRI